VIIVLCVVTILLVRGAWGVMEKNLESKKNVVLLEDQLSEARKKNEELSKHIAILNTEEGVESEIRQKFSVSKDGEQVAVIIEPKPSVEVTPPPKQGIFSKIGNWLSHLLD
jgi:cell division protein FtsB